MAPEARATTRSTARGLLAAAAILMILATAAALPLPNQGEDDHVDRLVVGDLRLADQDEDARDGVHATFTAANLAPGDRTTDVLRLTADPPRAANRELPRAPGTEPVLDLAFHPEGPSTKHGLAALLLVEQLTYGEHDLSEPVANRCPGPVSLATLLFCQGADAALADLPAPRQQGTDLVLGLQVAPGAPNELQGESAGFTVEAILELRDPVDRTPTAQQGQAPPAGAGGKSIGAAAPGTLGPASLVTLCFHGHGDDALVVYVEEVDVPVSCEVVL